MDVKIGKSIEANLFVEGMMKIIKITALISFVTFFICLINGISLLILDSIKTRYEDFFYQHLYDFANYSFIIELIFIAILIFSLVMIIVLFIIQGIFMLFKRK